VTAIDQYFVLGISQCISIKLLPLKIFEINDHPLKIVITIKGKGMGALSPLDVSNETVAIAQHISPFRLSHPAL